MTKIEELEQKLNECQKELAELKESKKEGKWKPKRGDEYYYRKVTGGIYFTRYSDSDFDKETAKNTSIFSTYEECERYWHFMDTVKEKSYSFSADEWHTWGIKKYYIFYNYKNESFEVGDEYVTKDFGKTYFKNKSDAQYIIDNFKDELMEYWI